VTIKWRNGITLAAAIASAEHCRSRQADD